MPSRFNQIQQLKVIASLITSIYRYLTLQKDAPYIDLYSLQSDYIQLTPFSTTCLICRPYLSLVSTYTLRSLSEGSSSPLNPQIQTIALRLCFLLLVKQISQYFYSTNSILCLLAYSLHFWQAFSSCLQFSSVNILCIRMLELSINPITKVFPLYSIESRVNIKKRKRIRDRVEPQGIPMF